MATKSPHVRLRHSLENIDGIVASTQGMTQQDITENFLVMRAIERCIQIISEAAKELPPEMRVREADIPWRDIIGIGNLLRHEYYRIRPADLWDIVHNHLPKLRSTIVRLLSEPGN
jgi:uncharacterized protein with HEPN domain